MLPEIPQIIDLLREMSLFNALNEAQIEQLAGLFGIEEFKPGEAILFQSQKSPAFFIIFDGQTAVETRLSPSESQVDVYIRGDFFGEDSLLRGGVEPASISAIVHTIILRMEHTQFHWLIKEFPHLKDRLSKFTKTHQYLNDFRFDWLNEDEVVYQVRRRHAANLLIMIAAPLGLLLSGIFLLIITSQHWISEGFRSPLFLGNAVILGVGLGWLGWRWLDWRNDIYLVTSQRVVWNEKVIWLYESRVEAPLTTILSVNVKTSYIGRMLGFGDVIVSTYTGMIMFASIADPYQLSSLITEYCQRSQVDLQRADVNLLRTSIKAMISPEQSGQTATSQKKHSRADDRSDQFKELSSWDKYFSNIFRTRIEGERIITYRKHWLILLRKTLLPGVLGFALITFIIIFDIMYILGKVEGKPPLEMTFYGALILVFILLPWWLYHYVDWRNDVYQISDRSIFDIERKPFGSESRKSAPLDNILSLEHSRPGFIGYIFNVGFVIINVGDAKFTFDHVFQPARVQQDVFNRMNALRVQKQKDEMTRERERMLKLLEIYHDESESTKNDF